MRIANCESLGIDSDVAEEAHPDIKRFLSLFELLHDVSNWFTTPQCLGGGVYQLYSVESKADMVLSFLPGPFWKALNACNVQILDATIEQGRIRLTFRIGTTPLAEDPDSP